MNKGQQMDSNTRARLLSKGRHIFNVTEDVLVAMEDLGITKSELAERMGKQKSRISKLLDGSSNMTIGTLAEMAYALGLDLENTFRIYSRDRQKPVSGNVSELKWIKNEQDTDDKKYSFHHRKQVEIRTHDASNDNTFLDSWRACEA